MAKSSDKAKEMIFNVLSKAFISTKLIDKKLFERKKTFSMSSLSNRKKHKKNISLLSYPNTFLPSRTISSSLSKNEKKVSNLFNSKTIKRNDKKKKFHSNTISTKESVV